MTARVIKPREPEILQDYEHLINASFAIIVDNVTTGINAQKVTRFTDVLNKIAESPLAAKHAVNLAKSKERSRKRVKNISRGNRFIKFRNFQIYQ